MVAPAAASTPLMISSTCRVCAAASPAPTTLPSWSRARTPETYTLSPARMPGEYGASGGGDPSGMIGLFGIRASLRMLAGQDAQKEQGSVALSRLLRVAETATGPSLLIL